MRRGKSPDAATLRRLYVDEGLTCTDIGVRYGAAAASASKWIRAAGLTRTGSEAMRLRMARSTPEQRLAITEAAHAAVRGRKQTAADMALKAIGRQRTQSHISPLDRHFRDLLAQRGSDIEEAALGVAVGPYNVDVAIGLSVAVELWGGAWHRTGRAAARHQQRTRHLLDAGWHVVIVECVSEQFPLTPAAAEYAVAFAERVRSNPPMRRQYRVIRGTGQEVIRGCAECDDFPFVAPDRGTSHVWCPHQLVAG
jgi:hypothetical protein